MAVNNERPPTGYMGNPATNKRMGLVRLATTAEITAGVSKVTAVTPAQLAAATFLTNFASPPVAGYGSVTPRPVASTNLTSSGVTFLATGAGAAARLGNATGTLGFFGSPGATRSSQAMLINNVAIGGVPGTIANYTNLSTYSADAVAIRNNIYQLSLALAKVITAMRSYGLLS